MKLTSTSINKVIKLTIAIVLTIGLIAGLVMPLSAAEVYELSDKQKAFVREYAWFVIPLAVDHNMPWTPPMEQAMLEGDCGDTEIAKTHNNILGITDGKGGYRYYDSIEACWEDYFNIIEKTKVYSENGIYETYDDPVACIESLAAAGYAEDPLYTDKLYKLHSGLEKYRIELGLPTSAEYAEKVELEAEAAWEEQQRQLREKEELESLKKALESIRDDAISSQHQLGRYGSAAMTGGIIAMYDYLLRYSGENLNLSSPLVEKAVALKSDQPPHHGGFLNPIF